MIFRAKRVCEIAEWKHLNSPCCSDEAAFHRIGRENSGVCDVVGK